MRQEYAHRYGVDSHVLHNGAADDLFADPGPTDRRDDRFVVRYLGSIVPGQHFSAIEDIAAAVIRLADAGVPVRFEIWGGSWTQQHAETLTDGRAVVYCGAIGKAEGFALLKSADLLVIPVSFDAAAFPKNRLSLPTKLAECLASGTPTLVYGPAVPRRWSSAGATAWGRSSTNVRRIASPRTSGTWSRTARRPAPPRRPAANSSVNTTRPRTRATRFARSCAAPWRRRNDRRHPASRRRACRDCR